MEDLKQECIERLQILKLDSKIIKEFKENDKVYVSKIENGTTEVILDNDIIQISKMFEEKQTIKIYHIIIFNGTMYFLAIHTHKEEWKEEKADLKRGFTVVVSCDIIHKGIVGFNTREAGIETENGKIKKVVL